MWNLFSWFICFWGLRPSGHSIDWNMFYLPPPNQKLKYRYLVAVNVMRCTKFGMFLEGMSHCYSRASFWSPFFFKMVLWCSLYKVCAAGRHVINNDRKKIRSSCDLRWYCVDINFAKFGQNLKTHYADLMYFLSWEIDLLCMQINFLHVSVGP